MKKRAISIQTQDQLSIPELEYLMQILNNHPFVIASKLRFNINSGGDYNLKYGKEQNGNDFFVPRQDLVFKNLEVPLFANKYEFEKKYYYSVESFQCQNQMLVDNNRFAFDIFETIFFHLSRYEEKLLKQGNYLGNKLDFENQLLLVRSGIEKIPVVDELIELLIYLITSEDKIFERPKLLSHDIDHIQKFQNPLAILRKFGGHFYHKKPIDKLPILFKSYVDYLSGKDSFDTYEWMLSKKEIDKTIYFLVGGKHQNDTPTDINHPTLLKAIKIAKERNYKIGIHPSYMSWNDQEMIHNEKTLLEEILEEDIISSRQHYLNFDILTTPRLLQNIGISEDSSIGYSRYIGYRSGTGFPYKLYDFESKEAFSILEKPMVFMDSAWIHEIERTGINDLELHLEDKYGAFNFHNSTFDEIRSKGLDMETVYREMFV